VLVKYISRKTIVVNETRRTVFISETVPFATDTREQSYPQTIAPTPVENKCSHQQSASARHKRFPLLATVDELFERCRRFISYLASRNTGK
jgi:hypothetical protein